MWCIKQLTDPGEHQVNQTQVPKIEQVLVGEEFGATYTQAAGKRKPTEVPPSTTSVGPLAA